MKKIIVFFGVVTLLISMRPVLGLTNNSASSTLVTTTVSQSSEETGESFSSEAFQGIKHFYEYTGFANVAWGNIIMILIGIIFIYLAIKFDYEPLLLIPIGIGVIIGNIPFVAGNRQEIELYEKLLREFHT